MSRTATRAGRGRQPQKRSPARPPSHRRTSTRRRALPWVVLGAVAVAVVAVIAARDGDGPSRGRESAGSFVGADLHTLVVDGAQPPRLYVGGHQSAAVSTDGGRSWKQVSSLRDADAMGWAFLGDTVWMGGHPGLRRSADGGRTFASAGGELSSADVHALGGAGGVLYAASPGRGVLASTDDGKSWQVRSSGAGRGFMGTIVVDPRDAEHLFAPDMQAGVVESGDGGRSWRRLASPGMAMSVTTVGGRADELVVAGDGAAARTSNGGATWQALDVPAGTMVVAGGADGTLYAAVLDGDVARVSRSTDGGTTWELLNP